MATLSGRFNFFYIDCPVNNVQKRMQKRKSNGRPFAKGNTGRPKGAKNRLTSTVKETVLNVFNDIQSDPKLNLKAFAKAYPRDFYNISARLIPTEIAGNFNKIQVEIVRRTKDGTGAGRTTPGAADSSESEKEV